MENYHLVLVLQLVRFVRLGTRRMLVVRVVKVLVLFVPVVPILMERVTLIANYVPQDCTTVTMDRNQYLTVCNVLLVLFQIQKECLLVKVSERSKISFVITRITIFVTVSRIVIVKFSSF